MPRITKSDTREVDEFIEWAKSSYSPDVELACRQFVEKQDPSVPFVTEEVAWELFCALNYDSRVEGMGQIRFDSDP